MTITNNSTYVLENTGNEMFSIPKGSVLITESEGNITVRLKSSRKVLFTTNEYTEDELIQIFY